MDIELNWVVKERLLHVLFPAILEASLLREYDDLLMQQLNVSPYKVHFIADLSTVKSLPGLSVMMGLRHPYHHHLGYGLTVGLARNSVGHLLVSMGAQLVGAHHRDFNTFNEARSYLQKMEGI